MAAVFTVETVLRRDLDRDKGAIHSELTAVMRAPANRQAVSDSLILALDSPSPRPIVIAIQEVQWRYLLDDRFVVRSLDGRVDSTLLDYIEDGDYDHVGYLNERAVQFLVATPNYNRDPSLWALDRLTELGEGESLTRDGLTFSRLASGYFEIVGHRPTP